MMKLLAIVASDAGPEGARAKVYRDPVWNEYRVRYYVGAHYLGEKTDSFHDDQEDAKSTARSEVGRLGGVITDVKGSV